MRDVVQSAMQELSNDHREVIMLRHILDKSHAEMSELLGIPEKTVKSRLFTARQMLGRVLKRRGVESA